MIMEAMRLSLLEHEQQQQRQREEEERNRRNGGTSERERSTEAGNNALLDTPSGQRSVSVVPPEPVGERVDHRPSSSLPNNPLDGLHTDVNWQRNPSRFSTLAAAIGAANTVSAILSAEGREPTSPPLPSSSTQTTGADGDTATISSDSSGAGQSSSQPTPLLDAVDGDLGGEVDYATLPSSPESPDQPQSPPAGTGDCGTASSPTPGTPE